MGPPELSSTQSMYCVALATAFQLKVGVVLAMLPEGATSVAAPGGALATPRPVTSRVRLAPFAVKVRLTLAVAARVGLKRTLTACVAPTPTRMNEPPETTLKAAGTDAVPGTVPPPVFYAVKLCSAKPPIVTVPKFTVAAGLPPKSIRAAALHAVIHALSLPVVSTARTATE